MPKEEGGVIREYNAMHEENEFPKQLAEGGSGRKRGNKKEGERKNQRRRKKKGKREEERKRDWEKEENETVSAERRCVGFLSAEAFDIFSQEEYLESCCRILMTCLIVSLRLGRMCLRCFLCLMCLSLLLLW